MILSVVNSSNSYVKATEGASLLGRGRHLGSLITCYFRTDIQRVKGLLVLD